MSSDTLAWQRLGWAGWAGGLGGAESSVLHRPFCGITMIFCGSFGATPKPVSVRDNKIPLPVCSLNCHTSPCGKGERSTRLYRDCFPSMTQNKCSI